MLLYRYILHIFKCIFICKIKSFDNVGVITTKRAGKTGNEWNKIKIVLLLGGDTESIKIAYSAFFNG